MATPEGRPASQRADLTDRRRLQQIQQQQLTESRLNDDFLYWLKNKGPNYLFVILLGLCAVMGWNLWQKKKGEARTAAWADLGSATLPAAYEEVAATHKGIDSVDAWAFLSAADRYMSSIQSGNRFDRQASDADYRLTPELREQWLAEAERLYGQVIGAAQTSGEKEKAGFIIAAHFGKAAVAESRGNLDAAKRELDEAAAAAGTAWEPLARVARERADSLATVATLPRFPTRAELPASTAPASLQSPLEPPVIDENLIRELLTPSAGQPIEVPSGAAPATPPPATPPATPPPGAGGTGSGSGTGK